MTEAAGAAAGGPELAHAGLETATDDRGQLWALNGSEWQAVHLVRTGDTLWNISGRYYGTPSVTGVRQIHAVARNRAVQGPDPNAGLIPGDQILIPGLVQPIAESSPVEATAPNDYPVGVANDVMPAGGGGGLPVPIAEEPASDPVPNPPPTVAVTEAPIPVSTSVVTASPEPPASDDGAWRTWLVGGGIVATAALVVMLWPRKRRKKK